MVETLGFLTNQDVKGVFLDGGHPVDGVGDVHVSDALFIHLHQTAQGFTLRVNDHRPYVLFAQVNIVDTDFRLHVQVFVELDTQVGAEQSLILLLESFIVVFVLTQGYRVVTAGKWIGRGIPLFGAVVFVDGIDRIGRTHHGSPPDGSGVGQFGGNGVDFSVSTAEVNPKTQPFGRIDVQIQTGVVACIVGTDNDTFILEITYRSIVVNGFGTAGSRDGVILDDTVAGNFIPPIGVGRSAG